MRERRAALDRRRAREFETFAAGAAGRLLHAAALLTAEPPAAAPRAQRLLTAALARTYAEWDPRHGEDPYDRARQALAQRFIREAWRVHWRRLSGRPAHGVLGALGPQERLVLVLRLYEGLPAEQTAALIGLPEERVRVLCARAVTTMRRSGPGRGRRTRRARAGRSAPTGPPATTSGP
ncbi:sigma factor-like helix-turn-helix DNA-binding protein [Streptomyces sp. NPDC012623]|uniref:sigma factor-like helix-turn-helix DNA-binding protein n=1 Tax=unclassified Streptomyces TaxID=2593676 RepID=UPI0036CFE1F5